MPEIPIAAPSVIFQDPFSLKNLYKFIYFWLEDNGYLALKGVSDEANLEKFYSEQIREGDVKEYHIWWRTAKQPANPYFKYKINVNYLGLGMMNTEVIKNDKKYKMQIGEISVNISSFLITEANDKKKSWQNNFFLKAVRPLFVKRWYKTKIEQHEDTLYEETYKLQKAVKEFLELRQYEPVEDIFFNKKGFE